MMLRKLDFRNVAIPLPRSVGSSAFSVANKNLPVAVLSPLTECIPEKHVRRNEIAANDAVKLAILFIAAAAAAATGNDKDYV